jgi:hypothetical protein
MVLVEIQRAREGQEEKKKKKRKKEENAGVCSP